MLIPQRPTDPIEFVLSEHETLEDPPSFTLRPLKEGILIEVNNLTQSKMVANALILAARHSVKGWKNLDKDFADSTNIGPLPLEWKYELGAKAIEISNLTETQKN